MAERKAEWKSVSRRFERMRSRNCATEDIIDFLGLTPAEQQELL